MTDEEVYEEYLSDEEYDLDNAPDDVRSYRAGWNDGMRRASILLYNKIYDKGEWIKDGYAEGYARCSICNSICEIDNFCGHCGSRMQERKVSNVPISTDCWIDEPYLALSNPPKHIWKCRYCGNEITTDVTSLPDKPCDCLLKDREEKK